jgi:hypothetical protein
MLYIDPSGSAPRRTLGKLTTDRTAALHKGFDEIVLSRLELPRSRYELSAAQGKEAYFPPLAVLAGGRAAGCAAPAKSPILS